VSGYLDVIRKVLGTREGTVPLQKLISGNEEESHRADSMSMKRDVVSKEYCSASVLQCVPYSNADVYLVKESVVFRAKK
jgi:hypothetical protein